MVADVRLAQVVEDKARGRALPHELENAPELSMVDAKVAGEPELRQQLRSPHEARSRRERVVILTLDHAAYPLDPRIDCDERLEVGAALLAVFERRPGDDAQNPPVLVPAFDGPPSFQQAIGRLDLDLQVHHRRDIDSGRGLAVVG